MAIVDVHCHTFNADDLPVRGFVHTLHLHDVPLGGTLSRLIDAVIQTGAPGYQEEKARLDALLAGAEIEDVFRLPAPERIADPRAEREALQAEFDRQVEATFQELKGRDPALLTRVGIELTAAEKGITPDDAMDLARFDPFGAALRAVRWVKLFARSRLELTAHLASTFGDRVDLFCPLLVDLGPGLGDFPKTTLAQQVELQEKISRLSMQGRLPGSDKARIHPFIGFDPRRQLQAEIAGDIEGPLEVVQKAIEEYGFIGVKLYPPMGWRPIGNAPSIGMLQAEAEKLDSILRRFYSWCVEKEVPITAHCGQSNYAHESYKDYSSPENWIAVLQELKGEGKDLRLNLGHFGGAKRDEASDGWPWQIARATKDFPHLYADVGNHSIYDEGLLAAYLGMLAKMFDPGSDTEVMAKRLMFGTDWYMEAIHPQHEEFLDRYESAFRERFGDDKVKLFLGETARDFLGFNVPTNQNNLRLRERYERFAPAGKIPEWLA